MDPNDVLNALLSDFRTIVEPATLLRRRELTITASRLFLFTSSLLLNSQSRDVSSTSVDTHHPATAPGGISVCVYV
jgi:hypothetical protein